MRYPAERYVPSTRPYEGLPDLDYPFHDKTVTVTTCGRVSGQGIASARNGRLGLRPGVRYGEAQRR